MQEQIQTYLNEVTPLNILNLIDPSALKSLLDGYSFVLGTGISVMYQKNEKVTIDDLDRIDASRVNASDTYNQICAYWRDKNKCNKDELCQYSDKKNALRYFKNEWLTPKIYRCEPLGLFDMTYPLKIDSKVIGILFGGQIIIKDKNVNWNYLLGKFDLDGRVDWKSIPIIDTQIDEIKEKIKCNGGNCDLIELLNSEEKFENISLNKEELVKRFDDFLKFGEITQKLLEELYKAKKNSAERQLLHDFDEALSRIDLANPIQWRDNYTSLISWLRRLSEIDEIKVYLRKDFRFYQEIPANEDAEILFARDLKWIRNSGKLMLIDNNSEKNRKLLKRIGLGTRNVWAYQVDSGSGKETCGTFIVFKGNIGERNKKFLTDLCGVICTDTNLTNLIFRERIIDYDYRLKVALIGHSFRTPLQLLQFIFDCLEKELSKTISSELNDQIKRGKNCIKDAQEDLLSLLEPVNQELETFDIGKLFNYVIENMRPIANKNSCSFVKGFWLDRIFVDGDRYKIQRSLQCLLDNAIKYSYHGQRQEPGKHYEVRLWMSKEDDYVKLTMQNYGIGIPENKMEALNQYWLRGNVYDSKFQRSGFGLGLPYAIKTVIELNGWLEIESKPADSATRLEIEQYHRYVTTVDFALPIKGD